ncbi:MAG: protein kinase [bacterium]|nr:protein kinase [bacterium]
MSFKDNYQILEQIGTGSMATVSRAIQKSLDRVVVIKQIHPHLSEDPDYVERFEREAKAAASLHHVNIMDIFDFGREYKLYYIAAEYIDGPDLLHVLEQAGQLPLDVVAAITLQILNGLEHAHNRGIVHRDIKPANIMFTRTGDAKIADFGIAEASNLPSMNPPGDVVGTPSYMSPEQAEGKKIDNRSDLFSVGILLYQMITHSLPFQGSSCDTVIKKLVSAPHPPVESFRPDVPKGLIAMVNKALEKDPTQRFFDATEFAYELEKFALDASMMLGVRTIQRYFKAVLDMVTKDVKPSTYSPGQVRQISTHSTGIGKKRATTAILPLTGCFGCQINLFDFHENFTELHKLMDIKFSYAMDNKEIPKVDVGIVEGCVANSENEKMVKKLRDNCEVLVALGTCSCFGGIPGLRNLSQVNNVIYRSYVETESTVKTGNLPDSPLLPALSEHVRPVSELVKVDAIIPGCPSPHQLIMDSLRNLISGKEFKIPLHNLCYDCPRKQKDMLNGKREYISDIIVPVMEVENLDDSLCFLEQGVLCMGLSTREGCGARCVANNIPCGGCMGPAPHVKETGAKWINALGSSLPGGAIRYRNDLVGLGYRYTLPISMMPFKKY